MGTTNTQRLAANGISYTPSIGGQVVQHGAGSSTQRVIRDPGGKLIAWQTGGQSYYYVTDRQDSVLLLTNTSGAEAAEYGYLPYGNTYTNTDTGTSAPNNPYRYIGTFLDTTTSTYKMGARYYNPTTGRFTQPDPSGQEFNRYNYSASNPVTYSDPSGLDKAGAQAEICYWVCVSAGAERNLETDEFTKQVGLGIGTPGGSAGVSYDPSDGASDYGWSGGPQCSAGPFQGSWYTGDSAPTFEANVTKYGTPYCSAGVGCSW